MSRGKTKEKVLYFITAILCICLLFESRVCATEMPATETTTESMSPSITEGYVVTDNQGILTCTYNGAMQTDVYLAIKASGGDYEVVKPLTKKSVIYYFDANGQGTKYKENQFIKVTYKGSKKMYFSKEGTLLTNTIAGNKKQGYFYVDSTGIKVTRKEIKQAVKFVRAHTKESWSAEKKLAACYKYLWKNYTYQRFYESPSASKMPSYANYMFKNKKGNCYRYAASLAYIARVIGYDTKVVSGKISSTRGGMTPHGWTEIKMGDTWYIFDANMQRNFPTVDSYKKTEKTYPYRHEILDKYKMTVKNGKVSWK